MIWVIQWRKFYDDEGFEYVESRNSIRKRRLIENVNRCCLVGAPPPPVSIWLYKVVRGDIETIKNFMVNKNISVHDIKKISNSEAKYMSYKITIPKNFIKDVLNKSFWPPGIGCRIWKDLKKETKSRTLSFVGRNYRSLV